MKNMVGLALGNNPPYEFDIKPSNYNPFHNQISKIDRATEMDGSSEID